MKIPITEMDIHLLPTGKLIVVDTDSPTTDDPSGVSLSPFEKRLKKAFHASTSAGLFFLGAERPLLGISPATRFWRDFAVLYMAELCHTPDSENDTPSPISPPEAAFEDLLSGAPPMVGGEYLSLAILGDLWQTLDEHVRDKVAATSTGVAGLIERHASRWHKVGRVCFHLAENKKDPDRPFAFLATYAQGISDSGRLRHLPLKQALTEFAGAKNRRALLKLLLPVKLASAQSDLVAELVESNELYAPLAWTTHTAHRFLKDAAAMEASGVLVHLPDWWKKRARPQVGVTIGQRKNKGLTSESLLDFRVDMLFDGEPLTRKEIAELLDAEPGLVKLRGQWVEVDSQQIAEALDHWEQVEKAAGDGLSFIEGMRLLAGAPRDLAGDADEEETSWSVVEPGDWLGGLLDSLRDPSKLDSVVQNRSLKATLRPYQETGVRWLQLLTGLGLGACLADDMGLGKTIQVLTLLLLMKKRRGKLTQASRRPSLLVLPASLMGNWQAEIERFTPSLVAVYLHPSLTDKDQIKELLELEEEKRFDGIDVVLTTYGMARRLKALTETNWELVVLDEAQAIKNPNAQQTRSIKKIPSKSRIAMTGTPIENRLTDLWSLFDFLSPGLLGSRQRFKSFVGSLEQGENRTDFGPLRRLVSPYILRRLKTDKSIISDLPDKTEVKAFCGLSKRQTVLYVRLVEEMTATLESPQSEGIRRRGVVLSYLMKFKQLCNHPAQLMGEDGYLPEQSGKFARLAEISEEIASRGEKMLVFTQFREMTEPLAKFLEQKFGQPGIVLHGGINVRRRQKMVDAFQADDELPFFVLSLKAGGTGLNLTAASHVVHFDRWWNPAVENQATDRAFRIGQKRNVLVHKFICQGTIEEKIDKMIEEKIALADEILDRGGTESTLTEMNDKQLIDLVSLNVDRASM